MKKFAFDFTDRNKSVDDFILDFKQHLKKRNLTLENLKEEKHKVSVLEYFSDIIDNPNVNALKAFKELGFTSKSSYFSLSTIINKVKKYENANDFLIVLSEMDFFKRGNVEKEPYCILSSLIDDNKNIINKMVELGYPKELTGNRNYMTFLLKENNIDKINYLINNDFIYSLNSFAGAEVRGCPSLKSVEERIKAVYLILDNAIDKKEIKQKYAIDFLDIIVHSKFSTKEMIEEYINKYDIKIPSENFKLFFDNEIIKNINKNYDDKFICIYKNRDQQDEVLDKMLSVYFKKVIEQNTGFNFITKCLENHIPLSQYLENNIESAIVEVLPKGYKEGMKIIEKIFPNITMKDGYDELALISIDSFVNKNLVDNGYRLNLKKVKEYGSFIENYFCNQQCINHSMYYTMHSSHMHSKNETLFTLACKIGNIKLAKKIINIKGFDIGKSLVFYAEEFTGNPEESLKVLSKLKNNSNLKFLDLNEYKNNIKEIVSNPNDFMMSINREIEKNILLSSLNNRKEIKNKKRM